MGKPYSFCLVGHSGSGKTALAEAMLKAAKAPEAAFDRSPEEKNRGISIDLALGACVWKERKATILVTPGLGEFVEEIHKGLDVADLAVLVVNAEKPVEVVTEQAWEIVRETYRRPAMVFVNMMDRPLADPAKVLQDLKSLPGKFVPLYFPVREGGNLKGLVDLLAADANLPPEAKELRALLLEEVASFDDALLEKFLAEEEVGPRGDHQSPSGGLFGGGTGSDPLGFRDHRHGGSRAFGLDRPPCSGASRRDGHQTSVFQPRT
jgi:elongation factor G